MTGISLRLCLVNKRTFLIYHMRKFAFFCMCILISMQAFVSSQQRCHWEERMRNRGEMKGGSGKKDEMRGRDGEDGG